MDNKEQQRCGIVSIVGRPNVGKSTLVNTILGEKISIVSRVPQTTRFRVRGIYTDERGQIVFIDTPGLHFSKDNLGELMNKASLEAIEGADCLIHLVDTSRRVGEEEENVVWNLQGLRQPIILGLNKIDLKGKYLPQYISLWEKTKKQKITEMKNFSMIVLSGLKGINRGDLLQIIFEYLPQGPFLYPQDIISDVPQKIAMADIIREKFFNLLREELPHALGVIIEDTRSLSKGGLNIKALVLVERDSQKEIVIGKKGEILKKVGTLARCELEELLEKKIFLELYVKAKRDWRNDPSSLEELGLDYS